MAPPLGQQLRMFMTAGEIKNTVTTSGDLDHDETMGDMWDRKWEQSAIDEPHYPAGVRNLRNSIQGGFRPEAPIPIVHSYHGTYLGDGHHRTETMSRLRPDEFIPVRHADRGAVGDDNTARWVRDHEDAVMAKHGMYPAPPGEWKPV